MKAKNLFLALLLMAILPLTASAKNAGVVSFDDVSEKAKVAFKGNGKGVAVADYNNDGFDDILISNKGGGLRLFKNNGNGTFTDVTKEVGLDDVGYCLGSVFGDIDNDGWVDLYVPKGGVYEIETNRLFKNVNGKFVDITEKAGVAGIVDGKPAFTYGAAMADYDKDGFLDIYLANYGVGAKNILYRNNGDGTFTDVTDKAGVGDKSWSWSATWADVNGDGWPDLYVVNGRYPAGEPNKLYINKGDGTFVEMAEKLGVADDGWGLGATFGDVNNDGALDLYVSNYIGDNNLYINDGKGNFKKANYLIKGAPKDHWGKGPTFGDVNNDGWLDLYEGDCKLANQLYINKGGKFENMINSVPAAKCETVRTKGTVLADFNNDGQLDLYIVNWGAANKLLLNKGKNPNWLRVKLVGTKSNRDAIGAKIYAYDKGGKLVGFREVVTASGFCTQPSKIQHFGFAKGGNYNIKVVFPSGKEVVKKDVKLSQLIVIEE